LFASRPPREGEGFLGFGPLRAASGMEVRREDEFSPLKNARGTGEDDPDTSKADIMKQGKKWLQAVGVVVTDEGDNAGVEVSPLISYGGEGLEFTKGRTIRAPAVVEKHD